VSRSAAPAFAALSDAQRRTILERIAKKPMAVGALARGMPSISRPAVSQHLKVLKDAGLVTARVEGTRRIYQLDPRGIQAMRGYLDKFWDHALAAFKEAAEADDSEERDT
jgi:DNA-binding transcriptional ArsR family regulator